MDCIIWEKRKITTYAAILWWRHHKETRSTLQTLCERNPLITGSSQRQAVIWNFDLFCYELVEQTVEEVILMTLLHFRATWFLGHTCGYCYVFVYTKYKMRSMPPKYLQCKDTKIQNDNPYRTSNKNCIYFIIKLWPVPRLSSIS